MMALLYIRNMPEETKGRLNAWAEKERRSLSNAAIRLIELALDAIEEEQAAACLVGEE